MVVDLLCGMGLLGLVVGGLGVVVGCGWMDRGFEGRVMLEGDLIL